MSAETRHFEYEGHRLVYDEYGSGDRPIVLLPGLLLSRKMQRPVAEVLAERGNRVLCLDVLGHGDSDRPPEMWKYSMPTFGRQAIALLDHLEIEKAVIGGTSLGANATLEAAVQAPERAQGLVVEMPVLDNALLAVAVVFAPLLVGFTLGAPLARLVSRGISLIPRPCWHLADILLDSASQDPKPSASVLQGLFFNRVAPPGEERRTIEQPALVIGHPRDPLHPFSDSDNLVRELPNARLLDANSILELRLTPERLTNEIADFVEQSWSPPRQVSRPHSRQRRSAASKASSRTARRRSG